MRSHIFSAAALLALLAASCAPTGDAGRDQARAVALPLPAAPQFAEIASESGLDFRHDTGATGRYYFAEIMGSGGAFLDFDGDGDLDIYLVQGAILETGAPAGLESRPGGGSGPLRNRIFRNEVIGPGGEPGPLRFTDITDGSGTGDRGYGMGATVGDYDNDGDPDIYVTNFGPDLLLRNEGGGRFSDVTEPAGLGDPRWSAGASFFDYDLDGRLDLFVTAYADFTVATNKPCYTAAGVLDYCGPTAYLSLPCRLYRNRGDGSFEDVTSSTGIDLAYGHGLGVIADDYDGDGLQDVYVANDSDMNQLWMNRGGRFEDVALLHGVALNENGAPEAGMGLATADHDGDGDQDIFVTHLIQESNRLYENNGQAFFEDATARRGISWPSMPYTGFGVGWVDLDNDGDLDLLVVNGNVRMEEVHRNPEYPFDQPNLLMLNDGSGGYIDVSAAAGAITAISEVSRGAAFGDVDNDGDIDVMVTNNNGPVRLYRNDLDEKGNWLILRVIIGNPGTDAIGAIVRLELVDGRTLTRTIRTDGSYLSSSDPRAHFAWSAGVRATMLTVLLPGGAAPVSLPVPEPGRAVTIRIDDRGAGATK
jgi:hypothetical protein